MPFRPFLKIPTKVAGGGATSGAWIATEKIHGAQLVVAADDRGTYFGKRKAWLDDGAAFFGFQLVREELGHRAAPTSSIRASRTEFVTRRSCLYSAARLRSETVASVQRTITVPTA